jgi:transcriptional regulator with XRE-family HTH domain
MKRKNKFIKLRRSIGQNIYNIRSQKRITMNSLSKQAEINLNLLDQYEIGKNKITLEAIAKIASSLNITLVDLIA